MEIVGARLNRIPHVGEMPQHHLAHPPLAVDSGPVEIQRVFAGVIWTAMRPIALLIESVFWLYDHLFENPDLIAFKNDLWQFVNSPEARSSGELEMLVARYKDRPNFPMQEVAVILDFLAVEEMRPYIRDILAGANVCLELQNPANSETDVLKRCNLFKGMQSRPSSHDSKSGCTWGLDVGSILQHIHVWIDREGHIRFQLERSSMRFTFSFITPFKAFLHISDYFKYRMQRRQIGPLGESPSIDQKPVRLMFDRFNFDKLARECNRLRQHVSG